MKPVIPDTHSDGGGHGGLLWGGVILAYLAAIAVCTATHLLLAAALLLSALLAVALLRALLQGNRIAAVFLLLNLALVIAVLVVKGPATAIGLTLAIAQGVVGALFLRSLFGPGPDLITAIACAIRPERSARELRYTRSVCRAWAGFMLTLALISLAFTFFASPPLWWWWKLFGSWVIPIGFFIAEWFLRQWILRNETKSGIRNTLRALPHIDFARLFEL